MNDAANTPTPTPTIKVSVNATAMNSLRCDFTTSTSLDNVWITSGLQRQRKAGWCIRGLCVLGSLCGRVDDSANEQNAVCLVVSDHKHKWVVCAEHRQLWAAASPYDNPRRCGGRSSSFGHINERLVSDSRDV